MCAFIFLAEMIIIMYNMGVREYFTDKDLRYWHILDTVITSLALMDVLLTFINSVADSDQVTAFSDQARVTVALRLFRVARVARLMKLLRSP
eukprot:7596350-Heterocapsa_arctica.AAC.1